MPATPDVGLPSEIWHVFLLHVSMQLDLAGYLAHLHHLECREAAPLRWHRTTQAVVGQPPEACPYVGHFPVKCV
jgi:hypothetical protein